MTETRWERIGAGTGLAYVVLSVLATVLYPQQPALDDSSEALLHWAQASRPGIATGMVLGLPAAALFVWFSAHLQTVLSTRDKGAEVLTPVVYGAGLAVAFVSLISTVPYLLLLMLDSQPEGISGETVRMLSNLGAVNFSALCAMVVLFLIGLAIAALRGIILTRWLGILALVAAVCNTIALPIGATFGTNHGVVWTGLGWSGMTTFMVFLVATSIVMLRGPEAVRHPVQNTVESADERRGDPVASTHE